MHVIQVCQYEHQLFDHFFPGQDPEGPSLAPLVDPLATILYDALRPRFIQLHSLEELCEIVDILTHEASCLMLLLLLLFMLLLLLMKPSVACSCRHCWLMPVQPCCTCVCQFPRHFLQKTPFLLNAKEAGRGESHKPVLSTRGGVRPQKPFLPRIGGGGGAEGERGWGGGGGDKGGQGWAFSLPPSHQKHASSEMRAHVRHCTRGHVLPSGTRRYQTNCMQQDFMS